ncbi:transporter substrate-binding domain-containing protein [Roseateles asaccharophilus]|uniref:Polar amino acid transport system substrate-binding protein n=1 Tax=Roseateles asaccharophilus TaxID=582607 RepID=A0ABU2A3U4_9BURK|nr:transporter substrate-binding domain-containing protein [Roseateles asaccharophilus]MDR7331862.1 polar amino acid transport system substrate-binding protein [Roseateles asaccharophilus]
MPRAAALALLLGCTAQAQTVDMVIYPNAGLFEIENGRFTGPGAPMLARLETISGVRMNGQSMPIARALQPGMLKSGACLVGLPRTPEREAAFRWAGPWSSSTITLYGRPGETRQVNGPEDMRGATTGVLREALPAAWLKEHRLASHEVNDVATGLRILHAGRVDYWLGSDVVARFAVKASGVPAPRVLYSFGRIDLHMACHPGTPAAIVERLHAGIEQLRRSGELVEFGLGR